MMLTWKYCMPAFLVPFMFTLNREGATLLLLGEGGVLTADLGITAWTFVTSCVAVAALAVAFGGWFLHRAALPERILMGLGGTALLYANPVSDGLGAVLLIAGAAVHLLSSRTTTSATG